MSNPLTDGLLTGNYADGETGWGGSMDTNLLRLGWMVQPAVLALQNTPPVTPAVNDRYIVGTAPTGAWVGNDNALARWNGTAWEYLTPVTNWVVLNIGTTADLLWNGAAWVATGVAPGPHAATHLPAGADPLAWAASIHAAGTLAGRPAAAAANAGLLYFATDTAQLFRSDGATWTALALPAIGGNRIRAQQVILSGVTYTPPAGCTRVEAELYAGGAGGGGCSSGGGGNWAGGAGGGAGGYARKSFAVVAGTPYAIAIGAGGAGGANTGAAGANGGNTTMTVGATTATAFGGAGGAGMTGGANDLYTNGGAGGALSTNGDLNGAGAPGEGGDRYLGTPSFDALGGRGGSGPIGGGGIARRAQAAPGAGNAATGLAAGGGGALVVNGSAAAVGGAGTGGAILIVEFTA